MSRDSPCGIGVQWDGVIQSILTSFRRTWSISTAEKKATLYILLSVCQAEARDTNLRDVIYPQLLTEHCTSP